MNLSNFVLPNSIHSLISFDQAHLINFSLNLFLEIFLTIIIMAKIANIIVFKVVKQ